jgi:hypothetical protein
MEKELFCSSYKPRILIGLMEMNLNNVLIIPFSKINYGQASEEESPERT